MSRPPLYVLLRQYRILPIAIIGFFAWSAVDITSWYKLHYAELQEWQVVPVLGYLASLVTALKFALDHALAPCPGDDLQAPPPERSA